MIMIEECIAKGDVCAYTYIDGMASASSTLQYDALEAKYNRMQYSLCRN